MENCAVLVVDDDTSIHEVVRLLLRKRCSKVDAAADGARGVEMLQKGGYDVVILDLMLPVLNGFQVIDQLKQLSKPPRLIVLSAISRHFDDRFPDDAVVLQKPFDITRVDEVVRSL